jgi:hypothetical protein
VIDEIKAAVHGAVGTRQKTAMLHFQVLKNADKLADMDPKGFCTEVAISEKYATEFRKMIALARLMKEQGAKII